MSDEPTKTNWTATVVGVAVVAVIAAFVVPRGKGPTRAEMEAARALRRIAELQKEARQRDGRYWTTDIRGLPGLDPAVAAADASSPTDRRGFNGYMFVAMRAEASGFGACAYPSAHPHDGRLTLIIGPDGVVWAKDIGGAPAVVAPRDPAVESWSRVE